MLYPAIVVISSALFIVNQLLIVINDMYVCTILMTEFRLIITLLSHVQFYIPNLTVCNHPCDYHFDSNSNFVAIIQSSTSV